ncbi:MAG TPA: Sua5/YciO/YrdC/YwlC family protein [Campylobacterales bacterium]|nr:Sua5/YciO/YrdC/YwlC family protein [Campylobacterales bacterium]
MDPKKIYLIQTDTTVGLASQNREALMAAKGRKGDKPFIVTVAGCNELKKLTRVPKKKRKLVRRAKKTTFVYPHKDLALRVVHGGDYYEFLKPFGWMYSTSANEAGKGFDLAFAKSVADETIGAEDELKEGKASKIILLAKKMKKIR